MTTNKTIGRALAVVSIARSGVQCQIKLARPFTSELHFMTCFYISPSQALTEVVLHSNDSLFNSHKANSSPMDTDSESELVRYSAVQLACVSQ